MEKLHLNSKPVYLHQNSRSRQNGRMNRDLQKVVFHSGTYLRLYLSSNRMDYQIISAFVQEAPEMIALSKHGFASSVMFDLVMPWRRGSKRRALLGIVLGGDGENW